MGKFIFHETGIRDLYLVAPSAFLDEHGYFMEVYNDEFLPYVKHLDGTPARFVQDNESMSTRDVLRGLHAQIRHPQGKLIRSVSGEIYDVAVDLRKGSEMFGK